MNVLYSVVDRIYVGNIPGIGELALAAIATVIGQLCSCIYILQFLFSKEVHIRIAFGGYAVKIMKRVLAVKMVPMSRTIKKGLSY